MLYVCVLVYMYLSDGQIFRSSAMSYYYTFKSACLIAVCDSVTCKFGPVCPSLVFLHWCAKWSGCCSATGMRVAYHRCNCNL